MGADKQRGQPRRFRAGRSPPPAAKTAVALHARHFVRFQRLVVALLSPPVEQRTWWEGAAVAPSSLAVGQPWEKQHEYVRRSDPRPLARGSASNQ